MIPNKNIQNQYQIPQAKQIIQQKNIIPLRLITSQSYQTNDTRVRNALNDAEIKFIQYQSFQQCFKELSNEKKPYQNFKYLIVFNNKVNGIPMRTFNPQDQSILFCSYPKRQNSQFVKYAPNPSDIVNQYKRLYNYSFVKNNQIQQQRKRDKLDQQNKNVNKQQNQMKLQQDSNMRKSQSNPQFILPQVSRVKQNSQARENNHLNSRSSDNKIRFKSMFKSPNKKMDIKFDQYFYYDLNSKTDDKSQFQKMINDFRKVIPRFHDFSDINSFKSYIKKNPSFKFLVFTRLQKVQELIDQIGKIKIKKQKDKNEKKYKIKKNQQQEEDQYSVYLAVFGGLPTIKKNSLRMKDQFKKSDIPEKLFSYQNILIISENPGQIIQFMKIIDPQIQNGYQLLMNMKMSNLKQTIQNNKPNQQTEKNKNNDVINPTLIKSEPNHIVNNEENKNVLSSNIHNTVPIIQSRGPGYMGISSNSSRPPVYQIVNPNQNQQQKKSQNMNNSSIQHSENNLQTQVSKKTQQSQQTNNNLLNLKKNPHNSSTFTFGKNSIIDQKNKQQNKKSIIQDNLIIPEDLNDQSNTNSENNFLIQKPSTSIQSNKIINQNKQVNENISNLIIPSTYNKIQDKKLVENNQNQKNKENLKEKKMIPYEQSGIVSASGIRQITNNMLLTKFNNQQKNFGDVVNNRRSSKQIINSGNKEVMKWKIDNGQVTSLNTNVKFNGTTDYKKRHQENNNSKVQQNQIEQKKPYEENAKKQINPNLQTQPIIIQQNSRLTKKQEKGDRQNPEKSMILKNKNQQIDPKNRNQNQSLNKDQDINTKKETPYQQVYFTRQQFHKTPKTPQKKYSDINQSQIKKNNLNNIYNVFQPNSPNKNYEGVTYINQQNKSPYKVMESKYQNIKNSPYSKDNFSNKRSYQNIYSPGKSNNFVNQNSNLGSQQNYNQKYSHNSYNSNSRINYSNSSSRVNQYLKDHPNYQAVQINGVTTLRPKKQAQNKISNVNNYDFSSRKNNVISESKRDLIQIFGKKQKTDYHSQQKNFIKRKQQELYKKISPQKNYYYQYKKVQEYQTGPSETILKLESKKQLNNKNRIFVTGGQYSNRLQTIPKSPNKNPVYGSCHYLIKDPQFNGKNVPQDVNLRNIQKQIRKSLMSYDKLDLYKTQEQLQELVRKNYENQLIKYDLGLVFNNRSNFQEMIVRQEDKQKRYYMIYIDSKQKQIKFWNDKLIHVPQPFTDKKINQIKQFIKKRKGITLSRNLNDDGIRRYQQLGQIKPNNFYDNHQNINYRQNQYVVKNIQKDMYDSNASNHSNQSKTKIKAFKLKKNSKEGSQSSFRGQSSVQKIIESNQTNKLKDSRQKSIRSKNGSLNNGNRRPRNIRLFFHENQNYLQNLVQKQYPNEYVIRSYRTIQQVQTILKDGRSFNKSILFLYPDLKNQKINFNLLDEVYLIGPRNSSPIGVISISGEKELIDILKYK